VHVQHRGFIRSSALEGAFFLPLPLEIVDLSRFILHKFTVPLFHFLNDASRSSVDQVPHEKLLVPV